MFMPFLIGFGIGFCFIVTGARLFFGRGAMLWRGWQSRTWPSTSGVIVTSDVVVVLYGRNYRPVMEATYEYEVQQIKYQSDHIQFTSYSDPETAARLASKYPKGKCVTVYYCPDKPELSVLEPGPFWIELILLVIGLGLLIMGLAIAIAFLAVWAK